MSTAKLELNGETYEFPVIEGSEGEVGVDIAKLRGQAKAICLDPGFGNTGSCKSGVTFINGEKGVLRYRGYPIEQLVNGVSFEETIYLLIHNKLPNTVELDAMKASLDANAILPEGIYALIESFPKGSHPMGVLQAATAALSSYDGDPLAGDNTEGQIIGLIAKYKSVCAAIYRREQGLPRAYPTPGLSYAADFAKMAFGRPNDGGKVDQDIEDALDNLLILHADHEQNCSASTVRMVGSAHANIYASISAGVGALWGPRHGGANQRVLEMLEDIQQSDVGYSEYVTKAKDKTSGVRLMGFGHRVYKNHDPRATLIKVSCDKILGNLEQEDPLLDIAKSLEQVALNDEYFVKRKLFPNVDFYSGIIYRALGIPVNMFTVMFALGRLPGWIAQWQELREDGQRIHRPRQIYTGENARDVLALSDRD